MADWDEDSPELRQNLARVLRDARDSAVRRDVPRLSDARTWHTDTMVGLQVPGPHRIGTFRGEKGIERAEVGIGAKRGVAARDVARALASFERRLQRTVAALDALYPAGTELDADGLDAVIDLSAWAHAEWVRIHPFVNGNGRTARLWANYVLMRYGIPPVIRLRPRPDGGYGRAGAAAMDGDWEPTANVFRKLVRDAVDERETRPPPQ